MKAYPTVAEAQRRLGLLFPRSSFDPSMNGPTAARAVVAMLYVDAVVPDEDEVPADAVWARPSTITWMNEATLAHSDAEDDRRVWYLASASTRKALNGLLTGWGIDIEPWYSSGSREQLRDETLPKLNEHSAVRTRAGIPTTSPRPRWALVESFADLFDPALTDEAVDQAVETWSTAHLSKAALRRARLLGRAAKSAASMPVTLPDGTVRRLEPTDSSLLLAGVMEEWAPTRLRQPTVLTISEPGIKKYVADAAVLSELNIDLDVSSTLPDALLADVGQDPVTYWAVEVVSTDGEINEMRKKQFDAWAVEQGIDPADMRYLTVFMSRTAGIARKRLKDLAAGTFAWFLDEPDKELAWYELSNE